MFLHRALRPYFLEADEHTLGPMTLLDDVVFVAHPHPDDWDFYDQFRKLAKQYRDRYSFLVSSPIRDTSTLACYNNVDDVKHIASDVTLVGAFEEFIKMCAEPVIPEMTRQNEAQYTSVSTFCKTKRKPALWLRSNLLILLMFLCRLGKAYCTTLPRPMPRRRLTDRRCGPWLRSTQSFFTSP